MTSEKKSPVHKPICKEYLDVAVPDRGRENSPADVTKHNPAYQKTEEHPRLSIHHVLCLHPGHSPSTALF